MKVRFRATILKPFESLEEYRECEGKQLEIGIYLTGATDMIDYLDALGLDISKKALYALRGKVEFLVLDNDYMICAPEYANMAKRLSGAGYEFLVRVERIRVGDMPAVKEVLADCITETINN
jgi:hypothetical protein